MRIGVDARNLCGPITGIARYMLDLCHAMHDRGHELTLYAPGEVRPEAILPDGVNLRETDLRGTFGKLLWRGSRLPRQLAKDRLELFWGPAHRLPHQLPHETASVVTIHDLVWKQAPETMRWSRRFADQFLMPRAVRQADIVCVNSLSTGRDVAAQFPEAEAKTRLVYPSVPVPEPGLVEKPEGDSDYVLFVGTGEPRKNLSRLIEAFAGLPVDLRTRTKLIVVGAPGWKSETARSLAARAGVHDRVDVLGYVESGQLADLYANARCLAMPSLYEGFGLPILEANLRSVPVVTSNISSMPEVAGDAGIIVDPLDVEALTDALEVMLSDDTSHLKFAKLAKKNASRFSPGKGAESLESAFREAIELHAAKRARQGLK